MPHFLESDSFKCEAKLSGFFNLGMRANYAALGIQPASFPKLLLSAFIGVHQRQLI